MNYNVVVLQVKVILHFILTGVLPWNATDRHVAQSRFSWVPLLEYENLGNGIVAITMIMCKISCKSNDHLRCVYLFVSCAVISKYTVLSDHFHGFATNPVPKPVIQTLSVHPEFTCCVACSLFPPITLTLDQPPMWLLFFYLPLLLALSFGWGGEWGRIYDLSNIKAPPHPSKQ